MKRPTGEPPVHLNLRGTIFNGIGKGKYYVGHQEYQKRFEGALGYRPYPGTLNIKLKDKIAIEELKAIRSMGGTRIDGFTMDGESFSGLACFDGNLNGARITLLFIDVTHYNESVVELISPIFLRGELGLNDGEEVSFGIDVPDPIPGRQ